MTVQKGSILTRSWVSSLYNWWSPNVIVQYVHIDTHMHIYIYTIYGYTYRMAPKIVKLVCNLMMSIVSGRYIEVVDECFTSVEYTITMENIIRILQT
jgi:hypothetical protein